MSSFASPQLTAEVTAVARSLWISYCAIFAGSSLVIWDHISSFSHEVNFIWGRKLNSVTLLFHLNRWTTFIWAIMNATLVLPLANVTVLTILLFIFWAAFSGVRVYAISGGIWWPSAIVCALSLVPAGTNLYGSLIAFYYQVEAIPALGPECISGKTFSAALSTNRSHTRHELCSYIIKVTIATRVCVIASDAIVLLVTWYKTYKIKRLADQNDVETPLVTMLLRDGTLYFAALLVLNIFNIVGWIFVFSVQDFTTPLSSVIISHFLMNLRQASSTGNQEMTSQSWSDEQGRSPAVSLRFASFIDNMGESLTHGYDPADTDFSLTKVHDTNLPEDEISVSMIPSTAPHFPQTSIE
ncbi:hypothetical protein CERSUDRAFT_92236 [Gelatoporia subvermispora B]|uniref:DUF6533 domain-containing protein n=1 Tax=Ceriporiopsis subvermispora (strain B) TaxID=914234 RepID=M2RLK9_CERS8|nr:hypothetical protein CERSUDRAFT_92236 [Gelatoporia subvermispora B]